MLSAGRHSLRILHPDYEPLPRVVTIEPGSTLHLVLDLPEKGIPRRPRDRDAPASGRRQR
jgi:hypothetical protein